MRYTIRAVLLLNAVLTLDGRVRPQSGGNFDLSHNVVAGGGSSKSVGATFSLDGTVGQSVAGTVSTEPPLDLRGGFWAFQTLAPTAAPVTISGRVIASPLVPMGRIRITLVEISRGTVRWVIPNQLGYYKFEDLEVGAYLIRAESPNCQFAPSQLFVNLFDDLADTDFSQISP